MSKMTIKQAEVLERGQAVTVDGKPATFVALHTAQNCPGRYTKRALVRRDGREMSVRVATLAVA